MPHNSAEGTSASVSFEDWHEDLKRLLIRCGGQNKEAGPSEGANGSASRRSVCSELEFFLVTWTDGFCF